MTVAPVPSNALLNALPARVRARLEADLEAVELPAGKVLHEAGEALSHVWFPTTAIVSMVYLVRDGGSAEVALIGREGMVGLALFTGGDSMPHRALVLSGGGAWRLGRAAIRRELARSGGRRDDALQAALLRFSQALVTQVAQTAVCNRYHTVARQLCRWLLLCLDRLPGDELLMTQELIAGMLGVRREGITEAAGRLQAEGIIRYSRGRITVLDRAGLAARACECYGVVHDEYVRLLSPAATESPYPPHLPIQRLFSGGLP